MRKILWGLQEYAKEIINKAPFSFDYIVRDEYSQEIDIFAGVPVKAEKDFFYDTSAKYVFISDLYHYQDISRKLYRYGLREGIDFSGGFEYLDLDKHIKKTGVRASSWKEKNELFPIWRCRVEQMADYLLETDKSILDIGCGEEYLKKLIDIKKVRYIPCDYVRRSDDTVVCDLNRYEFPKVSADVIFISGCIEYIQDPEWLIGQCTAVGRKILISYAPLEFIPNIEVRQIFGYANHYSIRQFIKIFHQNNFQLSDSRRSLTKDIIFYFQALNGEKGVHNENINRIKQGQNYLKGIDESILTEGSLRDSNKEWV